MSERIKAVAGDAIEIIKKVCYGTSDGLVMANVGTTFQVTGRDNTDEGVETTKGVHVWDNQYRILHSVRVADKEDLQESPAKIRLTHTMVTEYIPNPEYYEDGLTIEGMAQSDTESDDLESVFAEVLSDEVKWEIVKGSEDGSEPTISVVSEVDVDKALTELWRLRGGLGGVLTHEEYKDQSQDIAFLAINTIKHMQEEIDRLKGK